MYHLPNKNWRRIGHYNILTHSDGTEPVPDYGDTENVLLTAMEYHIALQQQIPLPSPGHRALYRDPDGR